MFEGPMDLLLYLIRKQNLDILSIPIAKITEQYMGYINEMQILNINLAAEYLLMAAMLLAIKSRMLLPRPNILLEEEDTDPRHELIQKLLEYEQIKLVAVELDRLPTANRDYMWLDVLLNDNSKLLPNVMVDDLTRAWKSLILKSITAHKEHHMKREELSIKEHMSSILRMLNETGIAKFMSLFKPSMGVSYIVVNFIAILELSKKGLISISTSENDIMVSLL
jgi:segregation and condensation protein A